MSARVVILQRYVAQYRVPFFEHLRELAATHDIQVDVGAGAPTGAQRARGDAARLSFQIDLHETERRVAGRRFVVRKVRPVVRDAELMILEQARRNLDAYQLMLPRRAWLTPKIALWGHGRDYVAQTSGLEARLQQSLTRRSDRLFAYTRTGADAAVAYGMDPSRVTVVNNSIDTQAFQGTVSSVSEAELARFKQRFQLYDKTALFIGGLDRPKRVEFFLRAVRRVADIDPSITFLVVGEGDDRDRVAQAANRLPNLRYAGSLFGRDKALAFRASAAISMPGRIGLVAVDSFAAGVPIITTDWPWHAPEYDYLSPGVNAHVSADDPEAYSGDLVRLLNDEARLGSLRKACLAERDKYSVEQMARNYLAGILDTLG